MNGEITVRSKVGAGSVFEFTLPVSVANVSDRSKPSCSIFPPEDKRLNGMHVILVDSNLVRQVLLFSEIFNLNLRQLVYARGVFWLFVSLLITILGT